MTLEIPPRLLALARSSAEGSAWLARLPAELDRVAREWRLTFDAGRVGVGGSRTFVAFVRRTDGTTAVLKLGLPHFEAQHEVLGLRVWNGEAMVRLLAEDEASGALLIERCEPGHSLAEQPEPEQDRVIARLLRRLWRVPPLEYSFRPLSQMLRSWVGEALARSHEWPDAGLTRAGLDCLLELGGEGSHPARLCGQQPMSPIGPGDVLLATDLHAGNVVAARREPWLAIDPKPFVGDPAFDATQHLLNCSARLRANPAGTVASFSRLLNVQHERVHRWLFGRFAAHTRRGQLTFGLSERDALALAREHEKLAG